MFENLLHELSAYYCCYILVNTHKNIFKARLVFQFDELQKKKTVETEICTLYITPKASYIMPSKLLHSLPNHTHINNIMNGFYKH